MADNALLNPWCVVEEELRADRQRLFESLFSLGNGLQGHRGNFVEDYSGPSLQGCYLGGIYYPEFLPRRNHRKGLPETYAKMPNAANWLGIHVVIDGETVDLMHADLLGYRRWLDLQRGLLHRKFTIRLGGEKELEVETTRFQSMADEDLGALRYALRPLNFSGTLTLIPYIDLNVSNAETFVDEGFWVEVETQVKRTHAHLLAETRKTEFQACSSMKYLLLRNGQPVSVNAFRIHREKYVACSIDLSLKKGVQVEMQKFCANLSTFHHPREGILDRAKSKVKAAAKAGWPSLQSDHTTYWAERWQGADIEIEGDPAAQQGLRFSLFHLMQAYRGTDTRLSISPKGYTGERFGGCTLWTAEAFCLPFVLSALGPEAARNMLLYRYHHLPAAIENAKRLGFKRGAALYPMVTMTGDECNPEWELAFGAIHRNGAIAYSIRYYVEYTGDRAFLAEHGLEMLVAIARFWAQRVHFSARKEAYLIHGVTGPNGYANNVDNNWFTNFLAHWCLRYAAECVEAVRAEWPKAFRKLKDRLGLKEQKEVHQWKLISTRIYLPYDETLGIFPEHDNYLDKKLEGTIALDSKDRPLHRQWSWDRILRSGYIERADVLQGLAWFYANFSQSEILRNFQFYEAQTVHDAALSPAVHALLAARLGLLDKAYAYFLRAVRFDLDNLGGETEHGCHIPAMGAAWMALVMGFGGMEVVDGKLAFRPAIPFHWQTYRFKVRYRKWTVSVSVNQKEVSLSHDQEEPLQLFLFGEPVTVGPKPLETPRVVSIP